MEYPLFVMQEVPKMGVKQGGESFELEMGVSVAFLSPFRLCLPFGFQKSISLPCASRMEKIL